MIKCGVREQETNISSDVRQRLSSHLYIQKGMDKIREKLEKREGVKIYRERRDMHRFADDITILAESDEEPSY